MFGGKLQNALLWMNFDSAPDKRKAYGFFQTTMKGMGHPVEKEGDFYNDRDSGACVQLFLNSGPDIDIVLYTKDLITVLFLPKRKSSETYLAAGFWNMQLGKFTKPPLIAGTIDDHETGKYAADIVCYILDNLRVAGIGITMSSKPRGKHLEKQKSPLAGASGEFVTIDFFGCEAISGLDGLEALLSSTDREDAWNHAEGNL